jgi:hypothetical protein
VERLRDGRSGPLRLRDGLDQEPAGEVVAALGQADVEVGAASPVDLGGTARARATPPRGPAVAGLQQAAVDQPVEVELGRVLGDPDGGGGLLARHRLGLGGDEAVQGPPHGLPEGRDLVEARVEVIAHGLPPSAF